MKIFKIIFFLFLSAITHLYAQTVTITPQEYDGALTNPGKGFRPSFRASNVPDWEARPYVTLVRHYIEWNDIENTADDGVDKIIDYCNRMWDGVEEANVKIIPRVILEYGPGTYYWPGDMPVGDYFSDEMQQRIRNMIAKLGEAWNNDPRVAWVQTGIIGQWGEQEKTNNDFSVIEANQDVWIPLLAEEFMEHLPNKRHVVRNQGLWIDRGYDHVGVYWDSFGHTQQYNPNNPESSWVRILDINDTYQQYLSAPVEGEVAYDWGTYGLDNYCDRSLSGSGPARPTSTVSTPKYYNFIIDVIRQLHATSNGWISAYTHGPDTELGARLIQEAFGYRFEIDEFEIATSTTPGDKLDFTANIINTGSAPIYESWPIAFVLIDEHTRDIVFQEEIPNVNIREWLPGSEYDWDPLSNPNGTRVYLNPAKQNVINGSISIPAEIAVGEYLAGITILDPSTNKPGVFFAIENFFKESQSQPLCRIGIGTEPSKTDLSDVYFDDLNRDDKRTYSSSMPGVKTEKVTIEPAEAKVTVNKTFELKEFISPSNAEDPSVTWTTSDESIATVDEDGIVFGVSEGTVTITATANDGSGAFGTSEVSVVAYEIIDEIISVNVPEEVYPGESFSAVVEYEVSETRDIEVFIQLNTDPWTVYGRKRVAVTEGKGVIEISVAVNSNMPLGQDLFKIVVDLLPSGGEWEDRIQEVIEADIDAVEKIISVTKIEIDNCATKSLEAGTVYSLRATVFPADATDQLISWTSSDPSVATVNSKGEVDTKSEGSVTISVITSDGGFSDDCTFTIVPGPVLFAEKQAPSFLFYPNPIGSSGLLTIESAIEGYLRILDMSGKLMKTVWVHIGTNSVKISDIEKGVYVVKGLKESHRLIIR